MPNPGRVFSETKCVVGGSNEYTSVIEINNTASPDTGSFTLGERDSFDMIFDNDIVVDDLTVRGLVVGFNPAFSLTLMFPNGGRLPLSGPTANFTMNEPGNNNNWYRVPKWTRLRVSLDVAGEPTDGVLFVSVVGRG